MYKLLRDLHHNLYKSLWILTSATVLMSCVEISRTGFPVTASEQEAQQFNDVSIVRLTVDNISSYSAQQQNRRSTVSLPPLTGNWEYLIGVGDVLSITVWDHPELTLPAGPERNQIESGSWVNASGNIFYPYIGAIEVVGRSIEDVQKDLTLRLAEYIPDPQIEVKVAAFNSQKVIVTGAIVRPGAVDITNLPLTLVEAVNALGGLQDTADSHRVSIQRNGQVYIVDMHAFLVSGRILNNPVLRGGDIVNVATLTNQVAFVLGQINQPGPVELGINGISLTDAIARRGGLNEDFADAQGIFVFRSKPDSNGFDVFQLDATTPFAFVLGTKFALYPDDVVYVVADPAARWNSIIASLIPSITAIRGLQSIGGDL